MPDSHAQRLLTWLVECVQSLATVVTHLAHVAAVERGEPLEVDLRLLAGLQPHTQELFTARRWMTFIGSWHRWGQFAGSQN